MFNPEYGPNGKEMGVRVDDAMGETTLARFRVEAALEALDSIASAEL